MTKKTKKTTKKSNAKQDPGQALAAALEIQDDSAFMSEMSTITNTPYPGWALPDRPELAATASGVNMLHLSVSNGGLRQFIDQWEGAWFHEIESYCRRVGALRASEYLQEAAKLFPRGKVPRDDEKRFDLAVAYEPSSPLDPPDPFTLLDDKYREDVMAEIPAKLRVWIAQNADALADELAQA